MIPNGKVEVWVSFQTSNQSFIRSEFLIASGYITSRGEMRFLLFR